MALSATAQSNIEAALSLMAGNEEKPLDGTVAEILSRSYAEFGWDSQIQFLEDLRDKPFTTLLTALLAVA